MWNVDQHAAVSRHFLLAVSDHGLQTSRYARYVSLLAVSFVTRTNLLKSFCGLQMQAHRQSAKSTSCTRWSSIRAYTKM